MKNFVWLLLLFIMACSQDQQKKVSIIDGRWIDLTHDFSAESVYWPTANGFEKSTVFEGISDSGFYYTAYEFKAAEHGGTHIDAPIHFFEKRNTIDQIPLQQLIAPAVVIRIDSKTQANRNYQLSVDDILTWEKEHGKIPDDCILLIDTGFSRYWPDRELYMGTAERGAAAVKKLSFPGIDPETAQFLVSQRKIKAVGLDTPSIDYGPSTLFETHRTLFEHNIPGLENVANLDKLPDTGAFIFALPMKIKGGSGAPVRIAALLPADQ